MFTCTVSFTDSRIKPRVILVDAESRKPARREARRQMGELHPGWSIAVVTAAPTPTPKATKAEAKPSRKADPDKAIAWSRALEMGCVHPYSDEATADDKDDFWATYKSLRARQRSGEVLGPVFIDPDDLLVTV